MAPKRKDVRDAGAAPATPTSATLKSTGSSVAPSTPTTTTATAMATPTTSTPTHAKASKSAASQNWDRIVVSIWNHYVDATPQRTKLLDVFMIFLVAVGAVQFLYCVLAGNYPFNAFLSGFSATVGQFVLTASLRIQTTAANKTDFPSVSPERAFADYVVCSLVLHFFCVNFIN